MEALVKLYKDLNCTVEVPKINGIYTVSISLLATNNYTSIKQLYAKNVGDHKAYNVDVQYSGDIVVDDISISDNELDINQVAVVTVGVQVINGADVKGTLNVAINYDNLK